MNYRRQLYLMNFNLETNKKSGFTLLELVIVIAIISILFSIIVTVINPAQKIAKAYDSQRLSDMNALNKALQQYYIDNSSYKNLDISENEIEICDTRYVDGTEKNNCGKFINLSKLVPEFIVAVPTDPLNIIANPQNNPEKLSGNGYTVKVDKQNKISIRSINLTTNNTPISTLNNLKVVDTRYQIIILTLIITICVIIAIYFIVKRYKNRD
jgi:prepilin-type N-terminal cleavage/methylation domain-containing protein